MAFIEISDLNSAGSELFAGKESFLTELQATDSSQIFGGGKSKNKKYSRGKGGSSSGGKGGSSGGGKGGYGCGYGGGHGYNGGGSS
jgi:hypothetical protein